MGRASKYTKGADRISKVFSRVVRALIDALSSDIALEPVIITV